MSIYFFSGLIPSNYIEMRPHSWYYGRITRADAEKLLMNKVHIFEDFNIFWPLFEKFQMFKNSKYFVVFFQLTYRLRLEKPT